MTNSIDVIEMNVLFEMKSYIYQKVLGPELQENESLKREQKKALMNNSFGCGFVFGLFKDRGEHN